MAAERRSHRPFVMCVYKHPALRGVPDQWLVMCGDCSTWRRNAAHISGPHTTREDAARSQATHAQLIYVEVAARA